MTFYFLSTLHSPEAMPALFHLGASGATRLWLNGKLMENDPDDHPARFDQHAVAVNLQKGANTVLVKVSALDETPEIFLRVSKEGDRPFQDATFTAPAPGEALAVCDPASKPPAFAQVDDITAALRKLADGHAADGEIRKDLATVLDARRPYDSKQQLTRREMERVVRLLPKDPRAQAILAKSIEDDRNLRREALERALEEDPTYAPARTVLAAYYEEHGFARQSYDEAEKAVADRPDYYPAQIALSDAMSSLGLEGRGEKRILYLAKEYPDTPRVQIAAARVERSLGKLPAALDRYRHVLDLRFDNGEARTALAGALVDAGDVDGALALFHRAIDLRPTSIGATVRLADFLSFKGRAVDALALYDRLASQTPDDDSVFESRGQYMLRQGLNVKAIKDFQKALALKPQNPGLRDLVRTIEPEEDFANPYLRDAVRLAKDAPVKPPNGDDEAVMLANVDVVRVYPNGLSSRVHQEVIKVFNERGIDHARIQGIGYAPGAQEVKVQQARIIKKNGTVEETKSESDQSSGSYSGMYFDNRQRTVVFSNLEAGDVIEFTYRRDDISQENMFADYFGDLAPLQGPIVNADVDYVLIAPAGRQFYSNQPTLPTVQHTEEKTNDGLWVHRWRATNVPRIEPEPKMPGFTNVYAYLHVSTFKDWDSVARFWWGLAHDQLFVTPEVAAAAEDAVKGVPAGDVKSRVRAVYDYVVRQTHYVGIEFGIQGYQPHKVDRILAARYGDCKDKASLMYAMLNHLGIKSNLVLLRMRFLGQITDQPASLAVFNHAILYVPKLNTFLDGTAEFSGSTELPDPDQGAQVLVVRDDGQPSHFFTTPVTHPDDNLSTSDYSLQLSTDGSATISGVSQVNGQAAQGLRRAYESESGRREKFEQSYGQRYPGAKAVSFDIGDPKAIERPVELHFTLRSPQLAQKEGNALVFSPLGEAWHVLESDAPQSRRTYPVDLGTPWTNRFHYSVQVPVGYLLSQRPPVIEKSSPFGHYRYEVKPSPEGFTVEERSQWMFMRCSPATTRRFECSWKSWIGPSLNACVSCRWREAVR